MAHIGLIPRINRDGFDDCAECIACSTDYALKRISQPEMIRFLLQHTPYRSLAEAEMALRATGGKSPVGSRAASSAPVRASHAT